MSKMSELGLNRLKDDKISTQYNILKSINPKNHKSDK
jgi:hypothetical protein